MNTSAVQGPKCDGPRDTGIADYLARLDRYALNFAKRHKMEDTLLAIAAGDNPYSAVNSMVYLLNRSGFPRLLRLWQIGTDKIT